MSRRWLRLCLTGAATVLAAGPGRAQQPGAPVAGQPVWTRAAQDPPPDNGLMAPAPAVPPRSAYQIPGRPPAGPPSSPQPPGSNLPEGTSIPMPQGGGLFRTTPRYGTTINASSEVLPDGTRRTIVTGGLILNADMGASGTIELAADDVVIWRSNPKDTPDGGFEVTAGDTTEVYLAGNVIVRSESAGRGGLISSSTQVIRAAEVYYDVTRSKAVALNADLELGSPQLKDAVHVRARELQRLGREEWDFLKMTVAASKTPSDPGLELSSNRATLTERHGTVTNVFGLPYRNLLTGQKVEGTERLLTMRNATTWLEGIPVFYFPWFRTDPAEPLGPLLGLGFGTDRIYGSQFYTTWDVYKLLALKAPEGHRWRLNLDYLDYRGPGFGSDYAYTVRDPERPYGFGARGLIKTYGINDKATEDVLGGDRGPIERPPPPGFRGRAMWRHQQEILDGLYFQGQFAYVSDQNFLEQYYKQEWDLGPNQETFAYLTYQDANWWTSGLVQPRFNRQWIAQTEYLPEFRGALIGQSFFDLFVYNVRGSGGYLQTKPAAIYPGPVLPTDRPDQFGRFDAFQELSLPFDLGPVKLAPYGVLDLTQYTQDLTGDPRSRALGGGGVRGSIPFSRLFPDVSSELFNVRGLYHKATLGANWYNVRSNTPYTQLPYADRLTDDAVDQAYRNIRPMQPQFVPGPAGVALRDLPQFDPQQYAIRRLADYRVDTRDTIDVVQLDLFQRLQTKRGYPGFEHTVDVVTLDMSASYFPNPQRDNYGKSWAFLEYGFLWNVGDRVAVQSAGWMDPFDFGAKYYNLGLYLDRPDRTSFYVGYRQTDPINSKQVTGSVGYQLSRRYFVNASSSYDFGTNLSLSNSFTLTRTGSDLTFTVGVSYNALQNNFSLQFLVLPNLVASALPGRFNTASVAGRNQ